MMVLGICGTPRKGGNSEVLLEAALEPFAEAGWAVERILMSERRVLPCTGCERCARAHACVQRDDMAAVYEAYARCDAMVIASPVYWRNVPAQLKALFDRTYGTQAQERLGGKLGGAIAVGRGSGAGQATVLNIIHNFYLSCGMLCVPGELNGVSAVADQPGDIRAQPCRLRQARVLGENILRHAR
ncbi:MAG: flavodoxin family protein [Christensenellales bacterium]|jgi:multimeric flavodoxin WrbA